MFLELHGEDRDEGALTGTGGATDFSGTWQNELGSQMVLTHNGDRITGLYESTVSGGHAKTTGDLVGFADGDLLTIVVHWRAFQAITAWVGQLDKAGANLNMLWQMVKQVDPGDEWSSINAGADSFTKV